MINCTVGYHCSSSSVVQHCPGTTLSKLYRSTACVNVPSYHIHDHHSWPSAVNLWYECKVQRWMMYTRGHGIPAPHPMWAFTVLLHIKCVSRLNCENSCNNLVRERWNIAHGVHSMQMHSQTFQTEPWPDERLLESNWSPAMLYFLTQLSSAVSECS